MSTPDNPDLSELVDGLSQLPPVTLEALRLLDEQRLMFGGWYPTVSLEVAVSATQELIAYLKDCAALADRLKALTPIILPTLEIPSWPL